MSADDIAPIASRADFVGGMDPALVAASETSSDGATFHFTWPKTPRVSAEGSTT